MKSNWFLVGVVCVLAFSLSGCKVEKRLHRPGYHVDWHKKARTKSVAERPVQKELAEVQSHPQKKQTLAPEQDINRQAQVDDGLKASVEGEINEIDLSPVQKMLAAQKPCASIVLNDGFIIRAVVEEINQVEIKYRNCDNQDGPVIFIDRREVDHILFPNGEVEMISGRRDPYVGSRGGGSSSGARTDGLGITSMIMGIVGIYAPFFIFSIMALIFSAVSLGRINSNPDRFKGRGFGTAGLITGIIGLVISIIFLLLVVTFGF